MQSQLTARPGKPCQITFLLCTEVSLGKKKISFSFGFGHETQPWHSNKSLFSLLLEVKYTLWHIGKVFLLDLSIFELFMPLLQPTIHFQIHPLQTYSADAKSLCCTGSKSSFPFSFHFSFFLWPFSLETWGKSWTPCCCTFNSLTFKPVRHKD